ncbi:MAG: hypothetical protein IJ710_10895, partial [Prevotella sp.]|nr:hypothetical protein [Prevotella sp.]
MKKQYLMNGVAALALAFAAASCSHETNLYNPNQVAQDFTNSFEDTFGNIADGQDWQTLTNVEADVTVNLNYADTYTIGIYDQNPLNGASASLLGITQTKEGQTAQLNFTAPKGTNNFFVVAFDEKGRAISQGVSLTDGKLVANLGTAASAAKAPRRATEAGNPYAKTLNDYLNPVYVKVNDWDQFPEVKQITVDQMKAYGTFTDTDIESNSTLTNGTWVWDASKNQSVLTYNIADGKHFRVAAGTEITKVFHVNGDQNYTNDVVIYVEGKMHLNGNTLNGPTIVVAPGGEVIIDGNTNMSNSGRIIVMDGGKITGAKGVAYNINNGGWSYNAGTIEFDGELNVNGSNFYNNGNVKVDLLRNTAGGTFTNFGTIEARTNTGAGDTYNSTIVNGCYMKFTEDAGIGCLTLLENSRLDVGGKAEFANNADNKKNYLGASSEINVGTLYVNTTEFFGPENTSDFAIIKAEKIQFAADILINEDYNNHYQNSEEGDLKWVWMYGKVNNRGTIYLDWDNTQIVANKYEDVYKCILAANYSYVNEANAPESIKILASECTGDGYNSDGNPGQPIPTPSVNYSIAFEDLGSIGDFDFNDVVLYVAHNANTNKATVNFVAAGGILPVQVKYDGTVLFTKNDGIMTNTRGKGNVIATAEVDMTNAATDLRKFSIVVTSTNSQSTEITSA